VTFLIRREGGKRSLLTLPRHASEKIEISSYDSWMNVLSPGAK
jgi:hypothetical protein